MPIKPTILFALPCFNEEKNIAPLLDNFIKLSIHYHHLFDIQVVVIDDASTDNTYSIASEYLNKLNLIIIKHEYNKNLTGGINTAFNYFSTRLDETNPPMAFGLMDGDNSHNPLNIPAMFEKILLGYVIVVASRYHKDSQICGVVWWRQLLSFGLAIIFKLLRNIPGIWDYSCGFRLYSPSIVKKLSKKYKAVFVQEKSFASMVEILLKGHLEGALCTESPMFLRYDLKLGESKMPFIKTIIGNLKLLKSLNSVKK